jgi:hypothetical protein
VFAVGATEVLSPHPSTLTRAMATSASILSVRIMFTPIAFHSGWNLSDWSVPSRRIGYGAATTVRLSTLRSHRDLRVLIFSDASAPAGHHSHV